MKSSTTSTRTSFVRRKDGLGATVCKDVPPKSLRPRKKERLPKGKTQHHVSLPPEWEVALQEMYPDVSVAIAIRKFIIENIRIAERDEK